MTAYTEGMLQERTMSAFPLSYGTSCAIEAVFEGWRPPHDPDRPIPVSIDVANYHTFWVNLGTLFRNLWSATAADIRLEASATAYQAALFNEMTIIENLFQREGEGRCRVKYYYGDYASFRDFHRPGVELRTEVTGHEAVFRAKRDRVLELILKDPQHEILWLKELLAPKNRERGLMLTHMPYDLLSYPKFHSLDLLESHTGRLKPRERWYTKFCPVQNTDMSRLPFIRLLLFIFGDKSLIRPMRIDWRRKIIELSHLRGWTNLTTESRVRQSLELATFPDELHQLVKGF